jgi:hypothetical protein
MGPFKAYIKSVKDLTSSEENSLAELSCDTPLRSVKLIRLLVASEK